MVKVSPQERIFELESEVRRLERQLAHEKNKMSYRDGIRAAASFVSSFDYRVNHPWRLSDIILFKFNLGRRTRLNRMAGKDVVARAKLSRFKTLPGA